MQPYGYRRCNHMVHWLHALLQYDTVVACIATIWYNAHRHCHCMLQSLQLHTGRRSRHRRISSLDEKLERRSMMDPALISPASSGELTVSRAKVCMPTLLQGMSCSLQGMSASLQGISVCCKVCQQCCKACQHCCKACQICCDMSALLQGGLAHRAAHGHGGCCCDIHQRRLLLSCSFFCCIAA